MSSPSNSLVTVDRHYLYSSFHDEFLLTLAEAFSKDSHYTLFRYEDWPAWATFTSVFIVLITFDNVVLNRNPKRLTINRAILYTLFWVLCACAFCGWVCWYRGVSQAYMWMSGYMLEWMLSFDNLFVFHMIFTVYATPDHLKHRPLYLGICGAIFFRLAFIFMGEYLMHAMSFMHLVFGAFLVYTGIKTVTSDENEEDPSQQPLVLWLQRQVPFVSVYDERGAFFVRVSTTSEGSESLLQPGVAGHGRGGTAAEARPLTSREDGQPPEARYGTLDFSKVGDVGKPKQKGQLRATMLFLVVCCLEISDLLFAVDSVSAIVAQVNDLFLAYTSAVFAMLGLRATFFIIDVLAKAFSLLKYGVAMVLVFIGVKLMVGRLCHVPPGIVCIVMLSFITLSIVASMLKDEVTRWLAAKRDVGVSKADAAEQRCS